MQCQLLVQKFMDSTKISEVVRFEVFTAVQTEFMVVASYSVVPGYHRFGGPYCLHLQGSTQKSSDSIL